MQSVNLHLLLVIISVDGGGVKGVVQQRLAKRPGSFSPPYMTRCGRPRGTAGRYLSSPFYVGFLYTENLEANQLTLELSQFCREVVNQVLLVEIRTSEVLQSVYISFASYGSAVAHSANIRE